jgi:osmoprotectant transport system substrate-binding protein/osmoprotectant transport system permease protein
MRGRRILGFALVGLALSSTPALADWTVGSKNFSESRLLGEIFAQLLEDRTGESVTRRFDLAGTAICFRALQMGELDVYPEYTGTGLVTLLGAEAQADRASVMAVVRREFREQWDLHWLGALGFENSYEVAVSRVVAEDYRLSTIADLAEVAGELRFAFGYEFQEREDGLLGLRRVYGLQPGSLVGMQQTLKYQAAGAGQIDALDVYTTDGLILVHDLVVLDDDRGVFPPYEAAPLVSGAAMRRDAVGAFALNELSGLLSADLMRELNRRVEVDGEDFQDVAREFLSTAGVLTQTATTRGESGSSRDGSWLVSANHLNRIARHTVEHLGLVGLSLALGMLLALPLGFWISEHGRAAELLIRMAGLLQTIPSIALLAFMIPVLGIGARPAIGALFLYAIFPILRNTVTGLREVDAAVVESARALGMTRGQVLRLVRIPLAVPMIVAGVRTAAVITVGTATLAAFIGAGGLGRPIVSGLQLNDNALILSGAVPAALLAWSVDALLAEAEKRLRPRVQ